MAKRKDLCAGCGVELDGSVHVGGFDYCSGNCAAGVAADGKRDYDKVTQRVLRELVLRQHSEECSDDWYTLAGVAREKTEQLGKTLELGKNGSYDTESLLSPAAQTDLRQTRLAELIAYETMLLHFDDEDWWKQQMKTPRRRS